MIYNYLESLAYSYKKNGYDYYLIYYNDVRDGNFNINLSNISCYFAKSPILQNSDYSFTVEEDCVLVSINFNDIVVENIKRQDVSLILNDSEVVIVPSNSYIFTNAILNTSSILSTNIYPSFLENSKIDVHLNFINFMLVLIFITFFLMLLFRKLIFGG